jgi:hypothetical protein
MKATFKQWMLQVDNELTNLCGMTHEDLTDCNYKIWWEVGLGYKVAAKRAIRIDQGA